MSAAPRATPFSLPASLQTSVAHALADVPAGARIGVAVSGGGDSMALLTLVAAFAPAAGLIVHAATVDHNLRDGSRQEAEGVAAFCASRGIDHTILTWDDPKGAGNLQDRARQARKALLSDWAGRLGLTALLLGHTMDDQGETVLMRLARGSGVDGLAGIPARTDWNGVLVLRPLLDHRRDELRAFLHAHKITWVDDPSNDDPRFDRVKTRLAIAALGLSVERLAQTATSMTRARVSLNARATDAAQAMVRQSHGCQIIDADALATCDEETRLRLVAGCVQWVASQTYRPRLSSLIRAYDAVSTGKSATLLGCVLIAKSGHIVVARELRAAPDPVAAGHIWDGRWQVTGDLPAGALIGAIGQQGAARISVLPDGLGKRAMWAYPGVWAGGQLISVPGFHGLVAKADCIHDPMTFTNTGGNIGKSH